MTPDRDYDDELARTVEKTWTDEQRLEFVWDRLEELHEERDNEYYLADLECADYLAKLELEEKHGEKS
jgi:hypothetical protein